MADLVGQKFVFAVAQMPFESGDGNIKNMFATLVPVVSTKGDIADPEDFPNAGLVWWQVLQGVRRHAIPGQLLKATLERAVKYDDWDPQSKFYQVHRESVANIELTDLVEVLQVDDDRASELHQLIGQEPVVRLNRPCAGTVMVRWRGNVVGPFKANSYGEGMVYQIALTTHRTDKTVTVLTEADFKNLAGGALLTTSADVALGPQDRARANTTLRCSYVLLMPSGFQRVTSADLTRQTLESDVEVIRRIARQLLLKRERQETVAVLTKLTDAANVTPGSLRADERRVLDATRTRHESVLGALDDLAKALLDNGTLDASLQSAITESVKTHIDRNAAKLTADINLRVKEEQERLENLRRASEEVASKLDAEERLRRTAFNKELQEERQVHDDAIKAAREQFESEQARREETHGLLVEAVEQLRAARGSIVGSVLTTLSLLRESPSLVSQQPPPKADERPREPTRLPAPQLLASSDLEGEPDEKRFFERFVEHTQRRGFHFRRLDLLRFHLSAKCGDITILSGPSGIGKSSLPRLYTEALAGRAAVAGHRYLEVAVSPAWLDTRDLLGYVNTLDRRFHAAESGLFLHLAQAQAEWEEQAGNSGLSVVCLDEMNLAQVEHYFSGVLQAVERPAGKRYVSCFASESVSEDDPARRWATLNLAPSLRFIGTVNMDETTKQLSLRLLDRSNLIELRPSSGNAYLAEMGQSVLADGPPILLRNYQAWLRSPVLPPGAAELLDSVHEELALLGAPVSPRRQRAVATFVASTPASLCSPETALDCQIVQRLLPQVRGNVLEEGLEGLRRLQGLFEPREEHYPETLQALRRMVSQVSDDMGFAEA